MKVVKVYGALKERLGNQGRFEFDVNTPIEALKALIANFPGLDKWLIDSDADGVGYKVLLGKETIEPEEGEVLGLPWSERDVFSITPVITGAKGGSGKFWLGVGLIAAAVFLGPAAGAIGAKAGFMGAAIGTGTLGASAAVFVGQLGVYFALSGIAEMLSPTPKVEGMKERERIESYSFSGIANTAQTGTAVPIAYGRVFTGSAIISASLDTDQLT